MISQLAKQVRESLSEAFPNTLILDEEYVNYRGQRLFFDFYLPSYNLYIEVQGSQHSEFNLHFHGDAATYRAAKHRDKMKREWIRLNEFTLVPINFDEIPISSADLLDKILEAQQGG